jgi:hypothetical protein
MSVITPTGWATGVQFPTDVGIFFLDIQAGL